MKWVILCAVVVAALASPFEVKRAVRDVSASNSTGNATLGNTTLSHGCGVADLDAIQAQVISTLTDKVTKLIGDNTKFSRRDTSSSVAGASSSSSNGHSQSAAFAKSSGSGDKEPTAPVAGSLRNGPQGNNATLPGNSTSTPGNSTSAPGNSSAPAPGTAPASVGQVIVQNAAAAANMHNGTAISTVSSRSKRAANNTSVTAQKADASGATAVAGAESHSGTDVTSQKVNAAGGNLGVATAVSNGTGNSSFTSQTANSSGNQAISTATNTNGGNTAQNAGAHGGDLAVAQVSNSNTPPKHRRARSVCAPVEMSDKIRLLIKTTVEQAFEDVKKQNNLE